MKTDLKVKLLQHLTHKKQDEGFTLIELLVVIIIIGILSAIALPSFLNQANKAKQSEAKTYVGSMNRAQQAFYLENDYFANFDEFGQLGLGIKTATENYRYGINGGGDGGGNVSNYADPKNKNNDEANTDSSLKAYHGITSVGKIVQTSETTTLAVLCEAKEVTKFGGKLGSQGDPNSLDTDGNPICDDADWKDVSGRKNA
ncbi:type IV pilin-like G/H family protein [Moorena producens]|uniref:type IV pilin-like G/H family protein n=1 Tax=Moorena producens TaxID=1155739 RepID=UPI003C794103